MSVSLLIISDSCSVLLHHTSPVLTYLRRLCLLMQQRQACQVFQEGVGRIKDLGQEAEAFSLIVVQNLKERMFHVNNSTCVLFVTILSVFGYKVAHCF